MSTRDDVWRAKLKAVCAKVSGRFLETLDEAIEKGLITPFDREVTARVMRAYLEEK